MAGGDISAGFKALLSGDAFQRELIRQMAYADRMDSPLVLLVFALSDECSAQSGKRRGTRRLLAKVICRNTRLSDVPGWYDNKQERIGLILCGTPHDRASNVILKIRAEFAKRAGAATGIYCEAFRYPDVARLQSLDAAEDQSSPDIKTKVAHGSSETVNECR